MNTIVEEPVKEWGITTKGYTGGEMHRDRMLRKSFSEPSYGYAHHKFIGTHTELLETMDRFMEMGGKVIGVYDLEEERIKEQNKLLNQNAMPKIIATNTGGTTYDPVPAGNYAARCYSMVHIGTVEEEILGTKKMLNKVRITWELPTELKVFKEENGEQPYVLSKDFTLSMNEKATLRKWLESWRGKAFTDQEAEAFDISVLVGKPCMLNVIHKEKKAGGVRAEIASVSAMPKGLGCPDQINDSVVFTVTEFNETVFNTFPDFIKDKIKSSKEYKEMQQPNVVDMEPEHAEVDETIDPLPF